MATGFQPNAFKYDAFQLESYVGAGLADGNATAQAFPPSHGNSDGHANVYAESRIMAKSLGNADGFADIQAAGNVPAIGRADGLADVFSRRRFGSAALLMGI